MTTETVERHAIRTPLGNVARICTRDTTNDGALAYGLMTGDEYRLADLPLLTGWAIDVGAHIGAITVALAIDNPGLRVIAVEALPQNVDMIIANRDANGLEQMVTVVHGAAAAPGDGPAAISFAWDRTDPAVIDTPYVRESRYIGNMLREDQGGETITVDPVSLDDLMDRFAIERVALVKIDCEGCEFRFLRSPRIGDVERIVGEYHDRGTWPELLAILEPTHVVTRRSEGMIALFDAVLR